MNPNPVRLFCSCFLLASLAGAGLAAAEPGTDPICGDLAWSSDPCEYCGKDAYYQTGHAEMNHDCLVDVVDFALFAQDYGRVGDLSGDFNRSGRVDVLDFQIFTQCFFSHPNVAPCSPCGIVADSCAGTVRINFSLIPGQDVDRIDLEPFEPAHVGVIVQGCAGLGAFTGCLEGSPNVVFSGQEPAGNLSFAGAGTAFISPLDALPHLVLGFGFYVTDSEPASIRIADCPGDRPGLAWAQVPPARRMDFAVIAHGGINAEPPPDASGCAVVAVADLSPASVAPQLRCWPVPAARGVFLAPAGERPANTAIDVYDSAGRHVRRVHDGVLAPQEIVRWDARREDGARAPAGVYFVRMVTPAGSAASRVVLLRE